jgi:hypothetical protein
MFRVDHGAGTGAGIVLCDLHGERHDVGYCATGNASSATAPITIVKMASTFARTGRQMKKSEIIRAVTWRRGLRTARRAPSHGENRGLSPLGSANNINGLHLRNSLVSRPCPVGILVRGREPTRLPWPGGSRCPPKASRGLGSSFGVNFGTRPTRQAAGHMQVQTTEVWRPIRSRTRPTR